MPKSCPICNRDNPDAAKYCCNCNVSFRRAIENYDAFISYRREGGSETARLIQMSLQTMAGKKIFLDVDELETGKFDNRLLECIERTNNFLLIPHFPDELHKPEAVRYSSAP